ncbi:MAG TPA: CoA ester lyase [Casimicrobiaceae bacterium]|jgi:citrate lyase subunit beta/citryl-CoA lyase|nr:CoA ester lyase [Casimicrobiaceae bacterium]
MPTPITYLFVPGDRPERFDKALASGADAMIVDLEDGVAPAAKAAARGNVLAWIAALPSAARVVVRINAATSDYFVDDLRMLGEAPAVDVMLAKAERAEEVRRLAITIKADARILPLIESARGVANANDIAAAQRVARLAFGALDFARDLGLSGDPRGFIQPMAALALASRLAGLPQPIAAPTPSIDDAAAIAEDVRLAQAMGFGAKLCIHPRQLEPVHQAFAPDADAIAWAARVVAASGTNRGAVQVDGAMVDKPVVERARAILEAARR